MKELYNQIDRELLERWILEARQEDLHLDFKAIVSPNELSRDDRKNLAVALSGFANSDGGIIVWGVVSRKDPLTGVDAASELKPMQNARAILSQIQSFTGAATSPTVDGILHRFIQSDSSSETTGFIATFVPPSERSPYMAKLGEDRYYKRSGDSFYKMEHFDIEDMFGRRQRPKLNISIEVHPVQGDASQEELRFYIQNVGHAVAKYVGFLVTLDNLNITSVSGTQMHNVSSLNGGNPVISFNDNIGVIHPNGIKIYAGSVKFYRSDPAKKVAINLTYYCAGARTETKLEELSPRGEANEIQQ